MLNSSDRIIFVIVVIFPLDSWKKDLKMLMNEDVMKNIAKIKKCQVGVRHKTIFFYNCDIFCNSRNIFHTINLKSYVNCAANIFSGFKITKITLNNFFISLIFNRQQINDKGVSISLNMLYLSLKISHNYIIIIIKSFYDVVLSTSLLKSCSDRNNNPFFVTLELRIITTKL